MRHWIWKEWIGGLGSEPHAQSHADRSGEHPVVLSVAELALRHGIPPVREIAPVDADLVLRDAVADTQIDGRERLGKRRVAFVQIAIASVLDDQAPVTP